MTKGFSLKTSSKILTLITYSEIQKWWKSTSQITSADTCPKKIPFLILITLQEANLLSISMEETYT